jgi:hypothetical protein
MVYKKMTAAQVVEGLLDGSYKDARLIYVSPLRSAPPRPHNPPRESFQFTISRDKQGRQKRRHLTLHAKEGGSVEDKRQLMVRLMEAGGMAGAIADQLPPQAEPSEGEEGVEAEGEDVHVGGSDVAVGAARASSPSTSPRKGKRQRGEEEEAGEDATGRARRTRGNA